MLDLIKVRYIWIPSKKWHNLGPINRSVGLHLCILGQKTQPSVCDIRLLNSKYFSKKIKISVPWYIFLIVRSNPTQKTHFNLYLMKTKKNCNFRPQYIIEEISPSVPFVESVDCHFAEDLLCT